MVEKKSPIRLLRVAIAALIAELIPLIVLVAAITIYGYLMPGLDKSVYETFATQAAAYIGPVAGTLATLGMAFWAARKPENRRWLHGLLTGILVVILDLAIFATPKADFDLNDGLVLLAKFAAGLLGGYLAQRRYQNQSLASRESHRLI
ncbi:TIGR04086 family membrane protein [Adhaeribacter sp. BT258]|uniref:TIGR04086 family membrane protein n=1 Tax=Adhaeribacter terrigena TaxID=2793070 RepID=A0ABS1C1N8_9BACT|nr:TIGR04086 family membrane protein [Adhaeribacter terrigena]MBK0403259.1 TIGR04086 family membrane protein [Adhaeribacter terrigena]